ncbi:hypothetical protein D3C81_2086820 [compost metagenome]
MRCQTNFWIIAFLFLDQINTYIFKLVILHELILKLFYLITKGLINLPAFITNLSLRIQLAVLLLGVHQFLEFVLILVQKLMKTINYFILKIILINNFRINSYSISR